MNECEEALGRAKEPVLQELRNLLTLCGVPQHFPSLRRSPAFANILMLKRGGSQTAC